VLGEIADDELASASLRAKWLGEPTMIAELIEKAVFAKVPERFWDAGNLHIDNTSKGRKALKEEIESIMI
jgi:hypothetical protein